MLRLLLLGALGCSQSVDVDPPGDYMTWKRLDVTGEAPGHGDTYRIIYANDLAASPASQLYIGYPLGSIIVKEIHDNDNGQPGALRYVAIMRRTTPVTTSLQDQGGWLFSQSQEPNGPETHSDRCWESLSRRRAVQRRLVRLSKVASFEIFEHPVRI